MTSYKYSPDYLIKMRAAVVEAHAFIAYAQSIGAKFDGLTGLTVTKTQAAILDNYWRSRHPEYIPLDNRIERCNCGASCGENRYHHKGSEDCRYRCEYCLRGEPVFMTTRHTDSTLRVHRIHLDDPCATMDEAVCKRIHG